MDKIITYIVIGSGLTATLVLLLKKYAYQGMGQNDAAFDYIKEQNKRFEERMDKKDCDFLNTLNKISESNNEVAKTYKIESEKRTLQIIELDKKVDYIHYKMSEYDNHLFPFTIKVDKTNEDVKKIKEYIENRDSEQKKKNMI